MDFSIKSADKKNSLNTIKTDCIVIGIYENGKPTDEAIELDANGIVTQALDSGDISGKAGSVLLVGSPAGLSAKRLLLLGLGKKPIGEKDFRQAIDTAIKTLKPLNIGDVLIALPFNTLSNRDLSWSIYCILSEFHSQLYRSDALKNQKEPSTKIQKVSFYIPSEDMAIAREALHRAKAITDGMTLAQDLGNLPANICTPTYLAKQAKTLAQTYKFGIEILDRKQIESLKMGCFLSVAKGSDEPPKFIVLKHMKGKSKEAPVILVGKGITFDSGGISLKPGASMDEMKFDMCGAASVLGTFKAIGELDLKQNVIGIIPACENLPSGHANKPGDIVTSMSGQTVEILNTDAEGRLILCDALTYAEKFNPAVVIDIATLTGACIVALGHINSGLFTRLDEQHDKLAGDLIAAAKSSTDPVWRMPIQDAYQDQLKSNFADMANIGGQPAGCVTAACFLERFTRKFVWAHLDIAGTAWKSGPSKGATGRPVPLLCTYLIQRENH